MAVQRSPFAFFARDLVSALNFFKDSPVDSLAMQKEENEAACHKHPCLAKTVTYIQLLFSFLLLLGTSLFTKDEIPKLTTAPVLTPMSAAAPAAADVRALFERSATGDITALSCPCSRSEHSLGNITSQLRFSKDVFAAEAGFPSMEGLDKWFNDNFGPAAKTASCKKDPVRLKNDLAPLLNDLLIDDIDATTAAYDWVDDMKSAICEFAFGTRSLALNPESLFRGKPWQTDPNEVKLTACSNYTYGGLHLLPYRLIVSEGKEFFPFLQAERASKYQSAISATISSLGLYFDQLNASSPLVQILTQSAISPTELQQMARGAFDKERSAVGVRAAALLGAASSGALFEISLGPALANMYGGVSAPITMSSSLFSSPLPFGRADFGPKTFDGLYQVNFGRPENWLYLISSRTGPQSVAAAGMASLRIGLSNTLALPTYPIFQNSRDPYEYIAGSDFLTVLDACANGAPMRVELHSLFPTRVDVNFLSEEKCCGKYAAIMDYYEPPPILTVPVTCPASLVELGEKRRRSKLGRPVYESHLRVSVASLVEKLSPSEKAILVAYGARRGVTPTAAEAPVLEKMGYLFAAAQNVSKGKGTDVQERAAVLGGPF